MINHTSNHPHNHKLAAFTFYINRMITMPITHHTRNREWHRILKMAQNNGFPKHTVYELKERLVRNKTKTTQQHPHNKKITTDGSVLSSTAPPYTRSPIY
jgi:hypothetical protein